MMAPYAGKILMNNRRRPRAATAPALKIRFEIAAKTTSLQPSSALSLPALTSCAVESVIASTSVSPDNAATAYNPRAPYRSFAAATTNKTTA